VELTYILRSKTVSVSFKSKFPGSSISTLTPITDTREMQSNCLAVDFPNNMGRGGGRIVNAYVTVAIGVKVQSFKVKNQKIRCHRDRRCKSTYEGTRRTDKSLFKNSSAANL